MGAVAYIGKLNSGVRHLFPFTSVTIPSKDQVSYGAELCTDVNVNSLVCM